MVRASLGLTLSIALMSSAAKADTLGPDVAASFVLVQETTTGTGPLSDFRFLPDGRLLVVERTGAVRLRRTNGSFVTVGTFAVDLSDLSLGLLGMEVHPAFAQNGTLFFFLSAAGQPAAVRNRVVAATLTGEVLDVAGARVLVGGLAAPDGHNGGGLALAPDGRLFVSVGEGGCACGCAPGNQPSAGFGFNYSPTCVSGPNGKLLRIELDGGAAAGNPLQGMSALTACGSDCRQPVRADAGAAPRADLWAWGLRDARRLWVDPQTGFVWLADRGELTLDEIDVVKPGDHLGAPFREGSRGLDAGVCADHLPVSGACADPVYACRHTSVSGTEDVGCDGLVGGPIADVCSWPATLRGRYLFADGPSRTLYALTPNAARSGVTSAPRLLVASLSSGQPVSMQLGPGGALYIGTDVPGRILRLSPLSPVACTGADGGADGGTSADGGASADGGGGGGGSGGGPVCCGGGSPTDGGWNACGCSAEPGSSGTAAWWPFAVLAALLFSGWQLRRRPMP